MKRISGRVATTPTKTEGVVTFVVLEPIGHVAFCVSAGAELPQPRKDDVVLVAGEWNRTCSGDQDLFDFVYNEISINGTVGDLPRK